ncbi:Ig-like domain-containing protein, partial [Accumulibacter sp.]|uniref:Ig-like domain-containing protein n=1 Tax=Accumulibacter sp. TaxID=2053492 RepID=UPI002C1DB26C
MTRNRPPLPHWAPRRLTMALEARHLFDGAAPAEVAAAVQDDGAAAVFEASPPAAVEPAPRELIVVDSRVAQDLDVSKWLDRQATVLVLDQQSDGLAQIAAAVDGEQNLGAIHILSHGVREGIVLGQGLVDHNALQRQSAVLARIGAALSADGDILLYGCDLAADNRAFIDTLAALTQADVAASTDATGSAVLGGDWLLEANAGPIETRALALTSFERLLAPPSIVGGGAHSTAEDTPLVITGVSISDVDGDDQTVSLAVSNGRVTLATGSGVRIDSGADDSAEIVFSGTLTQVNAALHGMSFSPTADYFGPASIAVAAFDGVNLSAPSTIALTVTPVDDLPVGVPDLLTATEDVGPVLGDVLVNDNLFNVDSPIDTLSVIALRTGTVAAGSGTAGSVGNPLVGSYGSLTVNANGGYSYTLDNALATVQALRSGDTLSDRFTYTLSDGHSSAQADITVTVEGSNDAPEIIGTPATLVASSIPENASNGENPGVSISSLLADVDNHPVASDIDAGSDLGIAIYASSVSNGMSGVWQYSLDGGSSWTPVVAAFSATEALLLPAAAKLRFVADDNADDRMESGIASLQYYAWDGSDGASAGDTADVGSRGGVTPFSTAGLAADFIVSARNDVPTLTPVALVLDEGSPDPTPITETQLPVVDPDNQSDQLTYRVEELPSKGVFLKNGIPLSVGGLFTQDDVLARNISYRYTSGELSSDASDSVWFTLRDGAGGVILRFELPITIRDVNAQIAITGTTQAVPERIGDEASDFTVLNLGLNDADGVDSDMTLTISSLPDPLVGRLQYWDGSAYVDVVAGQTFLNAELLADPLKPLRFISTGAEPALVAGSGYTGPLRPSASFDVEASDNNPALTPTTSSVTVTLTIEARNDAPLPLTQLLTAPQGGPAVAITPAFLTSTDTDSDAAKRVYTVSSFPNAGLLRLNGVIIGPGATFTEADLSGGLLTYTHDGSATDANPLSVEDHFDFSVNDRDGGVSSGTLEINVSPVTLSVPDPGGTLLGITPEGLFTPITSVTLAGSESYELLAEPAHGTLYLNGTALSAHDIFTQAQLAAGEVVYVNLGDEPSGYTPTSYRDAFTVARNGPGITGNSTVELIVTPVDDAPTISQGNPDGGSLMEESATSGLDHFNLNGATNAVKLTVANLQYEDPDTDPAALSYVLESAPLGGDLRRWDGAAWVALAQGGSFAALDVENGKIAYFHSADSELRSDSITVHLRDGGVVQVGDVLTTSPPISEQGFVTVDDGTNTLAINKGQVSRSPSRTVTFTIANVNDAPVASDGTFTVDEGYNTGMGGVDDNDGRIRILDASILAASDSDSDLADDATYTIVSLPLHGSLEIDLGAGFVALAVDEPFDHAMLTGRQLRYVQDGSEFTLDSFTWRVNDEASDAPAARYSNVATVTINILPQNDPPVVFNNTGATIANGKAVPEGGVRNITADMLGSLWGAPATDSTDVDNTYRQTQFRIITAAQNGTLYLDNAGAITSLGVGASFMLDDIQNGYLKYRHNGSETPLTDYFRFKISDGSGDNEPEENFNFEIIPVNDAPQLSGLNPLTYFEDDGATLIDASVLFNDVDLANGSSYNPGTTLTIAYTSGGTAGDQLSVRHQGTALGQLSVVGNTVSYNDGLGSVAIATIDDGGSNGVNGNKLLITFNDKANVVAVKAVLENLSFHNTDFANASQASAQATRSLSYTFVDGGGTASYEDDAETILAGADTVTASNTIIVKQRNDAPMMSAGDTALVPITEDETSNGQSVLVSTLLGGTSDVDTDAVQGIAVDSLLSGNGTWQYSLNSTNGSDGTWSAVGSVTENSSLLLSPTAWLRFIPNGENATSANFTYRAWDQTTGTIGGRANSDSRGGTTAFSLQRNTVSLTVTAVNDAPDLPNAELSLTQSEDAVAPVGGAVGTRVSTLLDHSIDVDDGALKGAAIWLGADASNGSWWYTTDNGVTPWLPLDAADATNARLLAADARLYFVPDADYNGRLDKALALYAWDQSSGNNGESFNVGAAPKGGTTAFSTTTDTVLLTVTALNDAPTILTSSPTINAIGFANENTPIVLGPNFTLGDIDLERFEGSNQGQITLSVPHGAFVLDTTGVTVTAGTQATDRGAGDWGGGSNTLSFTGTLLQLQAALDTVEYVPGDDPDTSETITVTFNDLNNAGAGSASGGSDVHSVETRVDINNIAPVNDAPTSLPFAPHTVSGTEDSVVFFTGADALSIADVDARDDEMAVTLSIPQGTLTLGTMTGISFANGTTNGSGSLDLRGTVANINAALASLSYTPLADANSLNVAAAARTLSFAVSDQGFGLAGVAGVALSAPTREIVIDLAEINDDPLLDVDALVGIQTSGTLAATESRDGSTATVVTGITLADPKDIVDSGYGDVELEVSALHGTLSLDFDAGVTAVVSGRSITLSGSIAAINAAIAVDKLKYLPDTNFSGPDVLSLAFNDRGNSGGGELIASGSLVVTVAGINDAPVFADLGGGVVSDASFDEDGTAVELDTDATLSDPELSAFNNWGGAVLTLQRAAVLGNPGTAATDDTFGVTGSGNSGVNFSATDIRIDATVVGSFTNAAGVLTISFNDATTTAQANQVLRAVTYSNSNDNPPSQVTIGYTINDGNTNSGATAQGSGNPLLALEGSGAVVVDITAYNDAPVLTLGTGLMDQFFEDRAASQIAPNAVLSDPELSFLASGSGDWGGAQLSLQRSNVASPNPDDVFGVTGSGDVGVNFSGGNLRIDTRVVGTFTNAGGAFSLTLAAGVSTAEAQRVARELTYRNTRQTLGQTQQENFSLTWTVDDGNSGDIDTAGPQGLGGAKQAAETQAITLRGVNDAPVLADTVLAIGAPEDNAAPVVGVAGILVSSLTGGASDVDMNPLKGIAITDTDTALGTWLYTVDDGSSWISIGSVEESGALLLRDSDRIYFQPNTDANGTVTAGLTLRAWDQSGGTAGNAGTKVDTTSNGGITPFSTATDTVALTVNAENDAPTRLRASVVLANSLEDAASPSQETIAQLFDGVGSNAAFSDAKDDQTVFTDGSTFNSLAGIVITDNAATAAQGTWQYSADGSSGWTDISMALTSASGLFLPSTYTLRFQAAANWNGIPGELSVRLVDDSAGVLPAAGDSVDVSNDTTLSGGSTRYSDSANAVSLRTSITSVNDAPAGTDKTITAIEDTAYQFQASDFGFTDLHDSPPNSLASVLISTLPATGTLKLSGTALTFPQSINVADIANLTWVPPPDLNGTAVASFTFQLVDDGGILDGGINTDPSANTITLDVNAVADIVPDSVTTNSTAAITFDPLAGTNGATADNFEDPAAAISAIGDASHGSAVLNPDGTITYTPTPGYVGPDSFSYTVSSGGVSETATISVVVTNAAPVGNPDSASTPEDTPVSGNVLDNDTDSDPGDSKTVSQFVVDGVTVVVPAGPVGGSTTIAGVGTLTLKADGSYSFTPLADWNGNLPTVTYTLGDVAGATATATLDITVTPVADITADSVSTNSTAAVSFDPLAGSNGASADNFEDPAAAISAIGDASHGSAVLNPDGTITYTPTPGYVGPDSLSYTVTSGGVSETATISVIVTNAAPVGNPDSASTPEDTPVSGNVLDNDTDSDPGDSKTVSQFVVDGVTVVVPAGPVGGSTTIAGVGTLTLKADGSYRFTPLADWNGNLPTVTYTLGDIAGATATATLDITVTPVADITADSVSTNSTAAVSFDPLAGSNGASADNFEDPAAAISAIGDASHGSAVLNPDGTITYTPTPGYVGPDSFSYTVSSGGVSETATISVIVTNAAPVGNPDSASTPEDTPVSGNVLDNDTDSDPGDSKTVSQFVVDGVTVAVPPGAVGGSTTIAGVGTLT